MPTAIRTGPYAAVVVRFIKGIAEGIATPALSGFLANWAPPLERSRLNAIAWIGLYVGPALGLPVSGYLVQWVSWSAPYYLFGALGVSWYLVWLWLAFEKPSTHPSISEDEKLYLKRSIGENQSISIASVPWFKILTSLPVWAVTIAHFANVWTLTIIAVLLPQYFHQVFAMQVDRGSALATLPYLCILYTSDAADE